MVFIGDLHLTDEQGKGGLAKYIPDPDIYVMSEVKRCIKWAIKHSINIVIFGGDVCESPRMSYEAHLAFINVIKMFPNIEFYVILGNHDKLGRESSAGHSLQVIQELCPANLTIITEDTSLSIKGTDVKFCPWPSQAFDKRTLNIGHVEVAGSKGDSGRLMDAEGLSKSNSVICMGHLHTPHQIRNTYFVGTLYQTNFGEPLPKFFHHVTWASLDDYEINSIPFSPVYKLFNCVIESQADIKALPTDLHHLVKLVVKDGADIIVPDAANIVVTKAFKTKTELATILTEDLLQGSELVIKTNDFFRDWIKAQSVPLSLKKRAHTLRKQILSGESYGAS